MVNNQINTKNIALFLEADALDLVCDDIMFVVVIVIAEVYIVVDVKSTVEFVDVVVNVVAIVVVFEV